MPIFRIVLMVSSLILLSINNVFAIDFGIKSGSNSKCFLTGTIRSSNDSGKKGFESMGNRLRLTFDAEDTAACEAYIRSYCRNNIIGRGDIPVNLTGYFRPAHDRETASDDVKPTHTYTISESCKITVQEE